MTRRNDRHPDRISPTDGPASHAEVEVAEALRLESVRALIREQRRTTMRARTIAITLESALDEFTSQAADELRPDLERIELRRQWCQRALDMVQEVRAHALRTRQVFDRISAEGGLGRSAPARFAAADREIERHAERAEKAAVAGIGRH